MNVDSAFSIGSSIATMIGVVVVSTQLILLKRQESQENFSKFNERYDNVIAGIPLEILLDGKSLAEVVAGSQNELESKKIIERAIFDYFQLCEEQVNLFIGKRGFRKTRMSEIKNDGMIVPKLRLGNSWTNEFLEWSSGMKSNLEVPALSSAYLELRERARRSGMSIPFSTFDEHFVSRGTTEN
jgi:hypothetical protein